MKSEEFMSIIRKTQRLEIRPTRESDFAVILAGLRGQGPQKNRFDDEELELADTYTEDFCKLSAANLCQYAESDKAYLFRVFKKSDGGYAGGVIIKTIQRKSFQWAEVGYWLLNQHWGSGYGSEMLRAAIDIAFKELGFHRLEAHINLDNAESRRTAEKAGMELECIRKAFILEDGEWTDNMIFVINNPNDRHD